MLIAVLGLVLAGADYRIANRRLLRFRRDARESG
jgi:hypothetical protein